MLSMKKNYYIKLIIVNLITLSRLIASVLMPIVYFKNGINSFCYFIPFLFLTDLIDGNLSRRFKVETFLGSILDAVSDKLFAFVLLGILTYYYPLMILVILLEFIIFMLNTLAFTDNKNIQTSKVGKVKTTVLDINIVLMYLYLCLPLYTKHLSTNLNNLLISIEIPFIYVLIGIMIGMQLITLTDYKKKSIKQINYEKIEFKELKPLKEILKLLIDREFYINNKNKKLKELLYKN